ncbi:eukaryotic rRNA processing [Coprinellus micaceus]|uniref:Eukaryotic rRNA processing n=1 Tax=Coprinellus micaceus TaxID=71717 RepID=A0A4Y7U1N4_COPMI|nr:eukaryotic rRNA processing [Coprinellus micaceus]
MARLMKALGDDLDELAQVQISSLNDMDEDDEDEVEGSDEEGSDADGSEEEVEEDEEKAKAAEASQSEDEGEGEEAEEQVPVDEVDEVDDDAVFTRKVEVDNEVALERIRETIALDSSLPWTETLVVTYPETIDVDVDDDLNREVAFYKQALHCANSARQLAAKHSFPFTRPADYFAEMVKSDSHMERIRQRLLNETAAIKLSEDKRKQREGKKFGKQVQMEKLKEREKSKKDMEEKIKGLKRKRKDMLTGDEEGGANVVDDGFDIQVEDAIADKPSRPAKKAKMSRDSRDNKYGFGGGANRRSKQNTRESTDSFGSGAGKGKGGKFAKGGKGGAKGGAKGKPQRPGKSRRMNGRK